MIEAVDINWFPGHMTKANRKMQKNLRLVDCVAEIIDARIPISSRNPDLVKMTQNKPRLILFNKCDIANPSENSRWISYYKNKGLNIISIDAKTGKGLNKFVPELKKVLQKKTEQWAKKGMTARKIRVMVVGIPNVGKSSCINKLVGSKRAKVENRPGVTKGNQWFSLTDGIELLDTPGVLWPKIDNLTMGENLAFTGAVKDNVIDIENLALRLSEFLISDYPELLLKRYKLSGDILKNNDVYEIFNEIGKKRGLLVSGGNVDTQRLSEMLLDEFRMGKIGKITLETTDNL